MWIKQLNKCERLTILNWALACCTRLSCSDWVMLVKIPTSGLKCSTLPWRFVKKCPKLRMQQTRTTHWGKGQSKEKIKHPDIFQNPVSGGSPSTVQKGSALFFFFFYKNSINLSGNSGIMCTRCTHIQTKQMCILRLLWMGDIFVFFCGSFETLLNGNITPSYTNSSTTACRSDTHWRCSWCILAEDGADRHKPFQHCSGTVNLQSIWQSSLSVFHSVFIHSVTAFPWPLDQKLEFWFYRTREFCLLLWEFFRGSVENLNGFQTEYLILYYLFLLFPVIMSVTHTFVQITESKRKPQGIIIFWQQGHL